MGADYYLRELMGRFFFILGAVVWLQLPAAVVALPSQPAKAWTLADFGGVLSVGLEGHRNFGNGRSLFKGQCASCHQMGALGGGPARDLSKRSLTYAPEELLGHILSMENHPQKKNALLENFSQGDVLDLLAFILSGADAQSPFFFHP